MSREPQNSVDEQELTKEMVKAGVEALCLWNQSTDRLEMIVESIYLAMRDCAE